MASTSIGVALGVISLLFLSSTGAQSALLTLSKVDKQGILDAHNLLRSRIALGLIGGQPSASDMMLLEWDDRLAAKAATWAATCLIGHDSPDQRLIPGYTWVGQNWAGGPNFNLSFYVDYWFDEYKDYTYATLACNPGKVCGHYTQVVWSRSLLVGCAAANCPDFARQLVCNYARGGNVATNWPYSNGTAASQCLGEFVYTRAGLCLRRDQCDNMYTGGGVVGGATSGAGADGTGTGGTGDDGWNDSGFSDGIEDVPMTKRRARRNADPCRCAITCLNGGTLDSTNCKCACRSGFYGTRCNYECVDPELWRPSCEGSPTACTDYPMFCPRTCNGCSAGDISDKNAVNSDGIIARVP